MEMCDPIYEACGYRVLAIYVSGVENSDGRNTWERKDRTGLPWIVCGGSILMFGLTVGRTMYTAS